MSDDLLPKVERGCPAGGTSSGLPVGGLWRQAAKGSEDTLPRGSELRATHRGSKEAMLPIGGAYRQADKKSEDTLLG